MTLEVLPLEDASTLEGTAPDRLHDLLLAHRDALAPPDARLEPIGERLAEASVDRARLVLAAWWERAPVGLIDARFGWPAPGDLVVEQIVVSPALRMRGVGRALVMSAVVEAERRFGAFERVLAAVLRPDAPALGFWDQLGLVGQPEDVCLRACSVDRLLRKPLDRGEIEAS